jgi:hypothetical protein
MRPHSTRDQVRGATRNKSSCSITFFLYSQHKYKWLFIFSSQQASTKLMATRGNFVIATWDFHHCAGAVGFSREMDIQGRHMAFGDAYKRCDGASVL